MTSRTWILAGVAIFTVGLGLAILLVNLDNNGAIAVETTSTVPGTTPTTTPDPTSTTTVAPSTTAPSTTTATSVPGSSSTVAVTSPPGTLPPGPDPDAGQTADDPVPYQTTVRLDRWQVGVSLANLDATQIVLDFVPFNDPPDEGKVYVMVELSGVNEGSGISQTVFDWKLTAPGFEHIPDGLECGVIPESIYDVPDVPPGVAFKANVCFEIPQEYAGDELLLSLGLFDSSGRERFFALS